MPTFIPLSITILFWASAFPAIRAALQSFSPAHLGFLRFLVASLALAAIWAWRRPPLPKRKDWPGLFVLGAIGIAGYNVALNTGSQSVPSGVAGLLVNTAPVWTAIAAAITLKERADWHAWVGLGVAFAGAALVALRGGGGIAISHGAVLVLLASFCHATYITLQKKYVAAYGAIGVTCYAVWCGTACLALGAGGAVRAVADATPGALALIVYLGIVPAAGAYLTWASVLKRMPASRAVGFLFLVPVGAAAIGWLWLGEVLPLRAIAGGALVLVGVSLVNLSALTRREGPTSMVE